MACSSCELLRITGVVCPETGCPETPRECKWCGQDFAPEAGATRATCCSLSCFAAYAGLPDDDGWSEQDQLDLESAHGV